MSAGAPTFEATDQYDILTMLAQAEEETSDVDAFLDACAADAAAHGGIVSVNRVRALMTERDIERHRYSSFWSHFTGRGRPMRKATADDINPPWEPCEGSPSGNNGKPYRLRVWVGPQAATS